MRTLSLNTLTSSIALSLCLLVAMPTMAQNHRSGSVKTEQNRNNVGNRKPNNNNSNGRRPNINSGNRNDKVNNNNKPDNKKQPGYNHTPNKPGNNKVPNKPSNNKPGSIKPNAPAHHTKPQARPPHQGHVTPPPARPHRPNYRPMPRVTPPPYWRPHHNAPRINGILGLTFGTLYNITLDFLYSNNYDINGYTDNIVYLKNVSQFNYNWQDVMLNYTTGRLASAQFVNSTGYYDTGRYNNVYQQLCRLYGSPISSRSLVNGGHECVWYGGESQGIVSLEYYRDRGRYFTTLSFGSTL